MVRRSPAERYLKYLVSHPAGYDDTRVRNICKMQDIPFVGMPYLERVRELLPIPSPFYPEDRTHVNSQRFIVKERIHHMYHQDDDMLGALAVLDRPRQKEALEALLIARSTKSYISNALRQRDGIDISSRGVGLYSHYFFDTDLVGFAELRALMDVKGRADPSDDPDEAALSVAYNMASKGDVRRMNSRMTITPLVSIMEGLRRGHLPHNVDLGRLARIARMAAIAHTAEALSRSNPEGARDYALTAKMMTEVLEDVGSAADDLQGDLAQMLLETETTEVPQLSQLLPPRSEVVETQGDTVGSDR